MPRIPKPKKLNRYERKLVHNQKLKQAFQGEGLYLYENASKIGELTLPKPTASGLRLLRPGQKFEGDSYYMNLVRSNHLRLIQELCPPAPITEQRSDTMDNKLLLNQPDVYTTEGKVEHVQKTTPKKTLKEKTEQQEPVLLTEDPMAGVEIILE